MSVLRRLMFHHLRKMGDWDEGRSNEKKLKEREKKGEMSDV
jgi:hypothetical protein